MTRSTVTLRPMTAEQYQRFMDVHQPQYVEHMVASGTEREAAERKARDDIQALLPKGRQTPGHVLSAAYAGDVRIGSLWLSLTGPKGATGAWIYYVLVDEEHRGKGYGRALMRAAEDECRRRGVNSLGLNVFGGNVTARRLYESLGYVVTAQQMRKDLSAS